MKDKIIQHCIVISALAHIRGKATLREDKEEFDKADRKLDSIISELQKIFVEKVPAETEHETKGSKDSH